MHHITYDGPPFFAYVYVDARNDATQLAYDLSRRYKPSLLQYAVEHVFAACWMSRAQTHKFCRRSSHLFAASLVINHIVKCCLRAHRPHASALPMRVCTMTTTMASIDRRMYYLDAHKHTRKITFTVRQLAAAWPCVQIGHRPTLADSSRADDSLATFTAHSDSLPPVAFGLPGLLYLASLSCSMRVSCYISVARLSRSSTVLASSMRSPRAERFC